MSTAEPAEIIEDWMGGGGVASAMAQARRHNEATLPALALSTDMISGLRVPGASNRKYWCHNVMT